MSEQTAQYRIPVAPEAQAVLMDDLDHDFPEVPEEFGLSEVDPPTIPNEMEAERHLKAVSYYRREAQRIRDHAAAHRAQIYAWEQGRLRPIEARLAWHEGGLRGWFAGVGRKTVKLVYGTVKLIAGRESVKVEDEDAFLSWANMFEKTRQLIRFSQEPNKAAIRGYIQQEGEIPPGCDLVTGEDTIKIDAS